MNSITTASSFPVFQSFREGWTNLWHGQRALLRLLAVSSLIITVALMLLPFMYGNHDVLSKAAGHAVDFYLLVISFLVGPAAILSGVENRPLAFNLSGHTYWRYVKAVLLLLVLFMAVIFVVAMVVFGLNLVAPKFVSIIVGTAAVGALIYASIRLWFMIPMVISTETPVWQALKTAWAWGCGHFWRLFGVVIVAISVASVLNFLGALLLGLALGAYYNATGIIQIGIGVIALLTGVVSFHLLAFGSCVVSATIGAAYRHKRDA